MTLWWIGNIIFIAVIVPVVVMILNKVMEPAVHIRMYADDICDHVEQFPPHLESLQDLGRTRDLVRQARGGIERYARAIDQL
jgi:hypothetical protein